MVPAVRSSGALLRCASSSASTGYVLDGTAHTQALQTRAEPFVSLSGDCVQVGQTNIAKRADRQTVQEARFAISPLRQAEVDLRYVEARRAGSLPTNTFTTPGLWTPPSR